MRNKTDIAQGPFDKSILSVLILVLPHCSWVVGKYSVLSRPINRTGGSYDLL